MGPERLLSVLIGAILLAVVGWLGVQVGWDNVGSDLLTANRQQHLVTQLTTPKPTTPSSTVPMYPTGPPPVGEGEPVARMVVPSIDLDWVVVSGTSKPVLRSGPGWMTSTSFLGEEGNAVVSGHRTTYGAPFNRLDELVEGDRIVFVLPGRPSATYTVTETFDVEPDEIWVTEQTDESMLTLTTCTPEGSAKFRLVVRAALTP